MRKGFTLVELIFVIVIIGIMAAVAIPKFKYLKQNAEVSNIMAAILDLNGSGGASAYLNAVELNDINATELNLTNIYKFQGNKWSIDTTTNDEANYTSADGYLKARFVYGNDSEINVTLTCSDPDGVYKDIFDRKLGTGSCTSSGETHTINLATQE